MFQTIFWDWLLNTFIVLVIVAVAILEFDRSRSILSDEDYSNLRLKVFKDLVRTANLSNVTFQNCGIPDVDKIYSDEQKYNISKFFSRNQKAKYSLPYLIQNDDFCIKRKEILAISILFTMPNEFSQREATRKNWGNKKWQDLTDIYVLFLLASHKDHKVNAKVLEEAKVHGDIVQGSFNESYENLTWKTLTLLHWVETFCPNAKFVIKIDTDVFIDIFRTARLLRTEVDLGKDKMNKLLCYGPIQKSAHALKDAGEYCESLKKFEVTNDIFPFEVYLPYCRGDVYILTKVVASKIFQFSDKLTPFVMEDAYFTGVVTTLIGEPVLVQCFTAIFDLAKLGKTPQQKEMLWKDVLIEEFKLASVLPVTGDDIPQNNFIIR